MSSSSTNNSKALAIVQAHLKQADAALYQANQSLHANPEVAYKEHNAHDNLCDLLESQGFSVTRKAYGLDTSFEASSGAGGREVVICAEYDALPEIGHACGHNLIATASLAAFFGASKVLSELKVPGRVRVLGTPAEEGGGGKIALLRAGAFSGASASIMAHPVAPGNLSNDAAVSGSAALNLVASIKFRVAFRGKSAHAAGEPWNGLNALDAAVAAYNNVSLLRQQMRSDERVHAVIEDGGTVPNVIPDYTRMNWYIRSPTIERGQELHERVQACIEAGASAAGCSFEYIRADDYKNVIGNGAICKTYAKMMALVGHKVLAEQEKPLVASTDMGNVSHQVPSMHGAFTIPAAPGAAMHSKLFAAAAGERAGHEAAIDCGTGMALLAVNILSDDELAEEMQREFINRYD
ncbi:amidohydrolase, putative [Cordyceps militaris CM01]|uniref:Peptidase M20 domain-containing protein 2 n=1 Tax=Cordyceps militaris (strain CM01) TaxID=983644 RepID=G3JFC2_CORMM|nr:amidohydrolase, putative [Cordyceps militaris CM01]EGX92261.1 amidohydrolase, putative [Cordyceps militaris CM01]